MADLATLVMDKLEFLDITRKGLSKLQMLLIEIEVGRSIMPSARTESPVNKSSSENICINIIPRYMDVFFNNQ